MEPPSGEFPLGTDRAGRSVLLLTLWESEDAIRRFAGDDIGRAVFYPEDERFLLARDERVTHYDVVHQAEVAP